MAILETQELLESVETGIQAIITSGQSYQIGDRRFNRANLKDLIEIHKYLKAQYQTEQHGPNRNYARFREPL